MEEDLRAGGELVSTMAEVIEDHIYSMVRPGSQIACICGEAFDHITDHSTHVADALTKAGYGKLAEAWDEGAKAAIEREHTYGAEEKAKFNNPYRAEQ